MAKREKIDAFNIINREAVEAAKYADEKKPQKAREDRPEGPQQREKPTLKAISIRMAEDDVINLENFLWDNYGEKLASGCRRILKEWMRAKGL